MYKIKKKTLSKFFLTEYHFYKKFNNFKKKTLFVDRERIDTVFNTSTLCLAVSEKYKSDVIILSDQSNKSLIVKTYKKLGFDHFINGFSIINTIKYTHLSILSLLFSLYAILNIYFVGFKWLINKYRINGILVGDLRKNIKQDG